MADGNSLIEKLDGHNLLQWSSEMTYFLTLGGLWDVACPIGVMFGAVVGPASLPVAEVAPLPSLDEGGAAEALGAAIKVETIEMKREKSSHMLSLIVLYCKDHHLATIRECTTARECWAALANSFAHAEQRGLPTFVGLSPTCVWGEMKA